MRPQGVRQASDRGEVSICCGSDESMHAAGVRCNGLAAGTTGGRRRGTKTAFSRRNRQESNALAHPKCYGSEQTGVKHL